MTIPLARTTAAAALAVALTGCATDSGPDAGQDQTATVGQPPAREATGTTTDAAPNVRSRTEQAFVNELSRLGLPTHTATDTTVEVGVGICRSLAEGEEPDVILDRLRPLTSALAAQHSEQDTEEVGRALIDASRNHLCG